MRLRASPADAKEQVEALEALEGYPLAPTHVGRACRHLVPEVYSPGALGWAERLVHVPERDEEGRPLQTVEVDLPDAVVDRHEGKTARLKNGREVVVRIKGRPSQAGEKPIDDGGNPGSRA